MKYVRKKIQITVRILKMYLKFNYAKSPEILSV